MEAQIKIGVKQNAALSSVVKQIQRQNSASLYQAEFRIFF